MGKKFMDLALCEAEKAGIRGEVPVGAVIVSEDGIILAADGNRSIELQDPSGHAEMLVLRSACHLVGNYRLGGATLYVTLEPCAMCAGALVHARVAKVVFGARDQKSGGVVSQFFIGRNGNLNHQLNVEGGVLETRSMELLQTFFRERRKRGA